MFIRRIPITCALALSLTLASTPLLADDPDDVAQAQAALDWLGVSPGVIDGKLGPHTRSAILIFQGLRGLEPLGVLDTQVLRLLKDAGGPKLISYTLTEADLQDLTPIPDSWLARSHMKRLDHATLLERLAERSHVTPELLARMNPDLDWSRLQTGQTVRLFDFTGVPEPPAERVEISLTHKTLTAVSADGKLLARFYCSIAADPDKRPKGTLKITTIVQDPPYAFDPALYPESGLTKKLTIPPGPNNPVGTVWIGLSLPGYGIHGTPDPEDVGRTGSHGCFRLTNWDAQRLSHMVKPGLTVLVNP